MTTQRIYYAAQNEARGQTVWRFRSKKERDEWVAALYGRNALPAKNVERAFRAPGVFTRWGNHLPKN